MSTVTSKAPSIVFCGYSNVSSASVLSELSTLFEVFVTSAVVKLAVNDDKWSHSLLTWDALVLELTYKSVNDLMNILVYDLCQKHFRLRTFRASRSSYLPDMVLPDMMC